MADEDTERPRRPRWVTIFRMVGGIAVGIGSALQGRSLLPRRRATRLRRGRGGAVLEPGPPRP